MSAATPAMAGQARAARLTTAAGAPLAPYDYGVTVPFAGGFIGGNYQFDRFVVGVEGDWQGSNLIGNSQAYSSIGLAGGTFPGGPFTVSTTIKDYGSIRGRLGVAFDRFLLFGTAGWAWGNPSNAYALYGAPPFFTHGGISEAGPPVPGSITPSRTMFSGASSIATPISGHRAS